MALRYEGRRSAVDADSGLIHTVIATAVTVRNLVSTAKSLGLETRATPGVLADGHAARASCGQQMGDAVQALYCCQAGANSIYDGDGLLTTGNSDTLCDLSLLRRQLGASDLDQKGISPARRLNACPWA